MDINFYKYQGTGNDFVMIDGRHEHFEARDLTSFHKICDRRFGVGADGLILIREHKGYDFEMLYFNADGSQSMCGNGARCAVAFAEFLGIISEQANFLAYDGPHYASISDEWVELEMRPVNNIKSLGDDAFVNTGSPHYVRFVDNLAEYPVIKEGRTIRNDKQEYPEGTNVNFVSAVSENHIKVRTYERGVEDETLSCGTGVTACALVFGVKKNINIVKISTLGGDLEVSFERGDHEDFKNIKLSGPAKKVFSGKIALDLIDSNPTVQEIIIP